MSHPSLSHLPLTTSTSSSSSTFPLSSHEHTTQLVPQEHLVDDERCERTPCYGPRQSGGIIQIPTPTDFLMKGQSIPEVAQVKKSGRDAKGKISASGRKGCERCLHGPEDRDRLSSSCFMILDTLRVYFADFAILCRALVQDGALLPGQSLSSRRSLPQSPLQLIVSTRTKSQLLKSSAAVWVHKFPEREDKKRSSWSGQPLTSTPWPPSKSQVSIRPRLQHFT